MKAFPPVVIKTLRISGEMLLRKPAGFFDVFGRENFSGEVRFDDVLQSGDLRVIKKTAARANVGIDEPRVGRVLPPMGEFVAVGIEDRVEAKGLNVVLAESAPILRAGTSQLLSPCRVGAQRAAPLPGL
jgi:hypothetical protein